MADQTTDVLMRVVANGNALAADSLTTFNTSDDKDDKLREGFTAGYFCELIDFSFSAGLEGAMSKSSKDKQKREEEEARKKAEKARAARASGARWTKSQELLALDLVQQQRRRAGKRLYADNVDMQPVEYTRIMDSSSTLLFKALTGCETLDTISIVKRKAAGTVNSGLCYLRLDFSQVLLTKLDFKDEQHVMHESGTFIYRKLSICYRPQLPSGALGASIQSSWTMRGASA